MDGGMEGMGGQWQHLLSSAAKLKQTQVEQDRRKWEKWPQHYQHTLFNSMDTAVLNARELSFDERLEKANEFRQNGNDLFKEKKYLEASQQYEKAYAVFHYVISTDAEWKKNGIKDENLIEHEFNSDDSQQSNEVRDFLKTCMLNLTACYLKMEHFDHAVKCSSEVLKIDPDNIKGLYRRAEARIGPKEHGQLEEDQAIEDLKHAVRVSEDGSAEKRSCTSMLAKLTTARKEQRVKDQQTYSGFLDRGDLGGEYEGMEEIAKGKIELQKKIHDAEQLLDVYRQNGNVKEAEELRKNIKHAKRSLKKGFDNLQPVDYSKPTQKMIDDAKKFGLDLTNPTILAELVKMEQARREGKDLNQICEENPTIKLDVDTASKEAESITFRRTFFISYFLKMISFLMHVFIFYVVLRLSVLMTWRILDMGLVPVVAPWTKEFLPERFSQPPNPGFLKALGYSTDDYDYPESSGGVFDNLFSWGGSSSIGHDAEALQDWDDEM